MLIIGIDPGITGSICFFEDGKIIDVVEMPNMAEGKKIKNKLMVHKFIMKFLYV
jgi:crossover junction endodeoxyribonuclease RuvC